MRMFPSDVLNANLRCLKFILHLPDGGHGLIFGAAIEMDVISIPYVGQYIHRVYADILVRYNDKKQTIDRQRNHGGRHFTINDRGKRWRSS